MVECELPSTVTRLEQTEEGAYLSIRIAVRSFNQTSKPRSKCVNLQIRL